MRIQRVVLHCLLLLAVGGPHVKLVWAADGSGGSTNEERSGSAASASDGSAGAPSPSPSPVKGTSLSIDWSLRDMFSVTIAPTPSPTPTPTQSPSPTLTKDEKSSVTSAPDPTPAPTPAAPEPSHTTIPTTPEPTSYLDLTPVPGPVEISSSLPPTDASTTPPPEPIDSPDSPSPPPIRPSDSFTTVDSSTQAPLSPLVPPSIEEPMSPSPPRLVGYDQPPMKAEEAEAETREANPDILTPSSSSNRTDPTATPYPTQVDLSVTSTISEAAHQKPYRRGDSVMVVQKKLDDGTTVNVEVVVSGSDAPSILARNADTLSSESGSASNEGGGNSVISVLAVLIPLLAALTLAVLTVFHFVALRPAWTASMSMQSRPNQWELLVFITYIQAMASVGHYGATSVPVSMWKYLDGFSWTVFVPIHFSGSGLTTIESSTSRRLSEVVILDGLVAFADRIGVHEQYLLQTSVAGLVVLCGIVIPLACIVLLLMKHRRKLSLGQKNPNAPFAQGLFPRTLADEVRPHETECRPLLFLRGLVVILGALALYPVMMLASFEIVSQLRARMTASNSLAIAVLALLTVPALLVVRSMSVLDGIQSEAEFKNEQHFRVVWGVFSSSDCVQYSSRVLVTAAWLGMQIASALIVGTLQSAGWQLVCLLVIDAGFAGFVLATRPFARGHQLGAVVTVAVASIKALNTALAFAFLGSHKNSLSRRQAVATAFIAINSIVIALWFIRIGSTAIRLLRMYAAHRILFRNGACGSSHAQRGRQEASWSPSDAQHASALYVELPEGRRHAVL